MLNFRNLSTLLTAVAFSLFVVLLTAPALIFALVAVQGNPAAYFLSRRAAMLFLGIATLSFLGRGAAHSEARQAVAVGIAVAMGGLAILGVVEWLRGYAGAGVLLAVGGEVFLALSYLQIWQNNR